MLANLLPLCLLLGAARPFIVLQRAGQSDNNNTVLKAISVVGVDALLPGPTFYLPDGQCSGIISQENLCNEDEPLGVSVLMSDPLSFPLVDITVNMNEVRVVRGTASAGCAGDADVNVWLLCDGEQPAASSSRSALPLAP